MWVCDCLRKTLRYPDSGCILSLMNSATTAVKAARQYRVEGHGQSVLVVRGGEGSPISSYRNMPLITREDAWEAVKTFAARGDLRTIKVHKSGELVFRAFHNVDGSWIDANTALAVKL